jgi:predicted RNase H-like nuclease (RuvC/YqgF family)
LIGDEMDSSLLQGLIGVGGIGLGATVTQILNYMFVARPNQKREWTQTLRDELGPVHERLEKCETDREELRVGADKLKEEILESKTEVRELKAKILELRVIVGEGKERT